MCPSTLYTYVVPHLHPLPPQVVRFLFSILCVSDHWETTSTQVEKQHKNNNFFPICPQKWWFADISEKSRIVFFYRFPK